MNPNYDSELDELPILQNHFNLSMKFIDTGQWIEVFSDDCRRQTTNISKDFVATVVNCLRTLTFSR